MLEELKILNGELDLKFDKYNNIYTVSVDKNAEKLELEYSISDDYQITVTDNNLTKELNYVYLHVYNEKEVNTYTLIVRKDNEETASLIDDYKSSLDVPVENVPSYQVMMIEFGCFIILLIIFLILFHKKKSTQ